MAPLSAQETQPADPPAVEDKPETLEKKSDKPDAKDPPENAEKPEDAEKPATLDDKKKSGLTDQLLQDLGLQSDAEEQNPLDDIIERMRNVQQRLRKTETDTETRTLQTRIVKDLDDLIEKLKNQKPPPPQQNQNQKPPPPMGANPPDTPPRAGGQPKPQNSQKQQGGGEQQQKPEKSTGGKSPADKARESSNDPKQGRSAAEEEARQRMAKDVWGHLPPALRQELLNVYSEKFLPKYDAMVRKYYEALAEQNRKNP